jgi:hypothetical protein
MGMSIFEDYDPRYDDFAREIYEREDEKEMKRLNPESNAEDDLG